MDVSNELYIVGSGQNILADVRKKQGFDDRLAAMHKQYYFLKAQDPDYEPDTLWWKRFWYV